MDQNYNRVEENVTVETIAHPLTQDYNNYSLECDPAEEAITTDSDEFLAEPLRFRNFQCSTSSNYSSKTIVPTSHTNTMCPYSDDNQNIQVPIVGYEIMEERARFTVYKLRIENKLTGDCWYVFRRYTDFVRLCSKIRDSHPHIVHMLPRKRWLKNNFDPVFLEERVNGLQIFVNAVLADPSLITTKEIQDFFCLNEPPSYSDTNEESRAMIDALDETINDLKIQLREKEAIIDSLQDSLHTKTLENENLRVAHPHVKSVSRAVKISLNNDK